MTIAAVAAGGCGGVFVPFLAIGDIAGRVFAELFGVPPDLAGSSGAAAGIAGGYRLPFTAIMMVLGVGGPYAATLTCLATVGVATIAGVGASRAVTKLTTLVIAATRRLHLSHHARSPSESRREHREPSSGFRDGLRAQRSLGLGHQRVALVATEHTTERCTSRCSEGLDLRRLEPGHCFAQVLLRARPCRARARRPPARARPWSRSSALELSLCDLRPAPRSATALRDRRLLDDRGDREPCAKMQRLVANEWYAEQLRGLDLPAGQRSLSIARPSSAPPP